MTDNSYDALNDYVTQLFVEEDEALRWIQAEADRNGLPQISLKAHEGRLLQFLVLAVGAKNAVEIGTLAGYSGTWLARALPEGGKLYTLEKSSKHAQVSRASFERAGVAHKVEVLEGDALDSLKKITPTLSLLLMAEKASTAAISVTRSCLRACTVPNNELALTSTNNITVNSRSSSNTLLKG